MGLRISDILQRGCESKENPDFEAKTRGVNSVSDEKLHDFVISCKRDHMPCTPFACRLEIAA